MIGSESDCHQNHPDCHCQLVRILLSCPLTTLPPTLTFQIKLMISNLDFAQNDFLLKEGPRQQSVDIHARNCISFNSISEKDFTRPLPGHSAATLFKEILTEIIFASLFLFPQLSKKNPYKVQFLIQVLLT